MWGTVAIEMTAIPMAMDWNAALQDLISPQCSKRQSPCVQTVEAGASCGFNVNVWSQPVSQSLITCQCLKQSHVFIWMCQGLCACLYHSQAASCLRCLVKHDNQVSRAAATGQEAQTVGALTCKYKGFVYVFNANYIKPMLILEFALIWTNTASTKGKTHWGIY